MEEKRRATYTFTVGKINSSKLATDYLFRAGLRTEYECKLGFIYISLGKYNAPCLKSD